MDVRQLILGLAKAPGPDRSIDEAIFEAVAEARRKDRIQPDRRFQGSHQLLRVVKSDNDVSKIPSYTKSLDDALDLLTIVAPGSSGGWSAEPGKASACLNGGPYLQAASAPLAICMAALMHIHLNQ